MGNKPEGRNSDIGAGHATGRDRPDHERGSGKNDFRKTRGGNLGQGSRTSDFRERMGADRDPGADANDYSEKMGAGQDPGVDASDFSQMAESPRNQDTEKSDYQYKTEADKLAEAATKSGCLPKLFMLLMPFVPLGTYVLFKS